MATQHPFLSHGSGIFSDNPYYQNAMYNVVSAEPAGYAPDGSVGVWKVTYKDGTSQYEAPSQGFAGKGETNWLPSSTDGKIMSFSQMTGDGGSPMEEPTTLIVNDPSKVQYKEYMPEGMDSFGDFLKIAAPIALGALYAGGAFSGIGGAGASSVPTGAMSIAGPTGGMMSSTAALAPSVNSMIASPIINSSLASGLAGLSSGGFGMANNVPVDEWGSMNDYGVGEGVMDNPSLWEPSTTIPNFVKDLAKKLLPNGSASDIMKLAGQLIGNNQAHNAVEDTINKYADRLEGLSPISPAERQELGDIGMERFRRDYLGDGRAEALYDEYGRRGGQADNMAGMLSQLYTDPTQMGVFNAINDLATANTMRMQGARGTLQSGSTSNDYRNAAIKSMLELAQPMNQSLSTMYSGQRTPVEAFQALSGANNASAQQGAGAIGAASGTQSNLAAFMPTAFEASLRANPTLTGNQAIFGSAGRNSASDPSVLSQLAQFGSAAKGVKDGWTALSSLF